MKRRLFSILLVLCMTLAMLPAAAFAGESSYDSDITIKHSGWTFKSDKEVCYYIPTTNGKFSVNQPNSDSYLKVTKTGENEITITVHGNVNISVNKRDTIKSVKNLIITGATNGKNTLSLSTTKGGTAITVLGDLTVTGITLTATADNGPALRANNITISNATLDATNNSADSATIQATQGDGPLGNLTVSGTSAITVTNNNANGRAIHATIINGNETPGQTDASQVTISSPAPHSHVCSDGWTSDATGHWHRCTDVNCTEKLNFAAHSGGAATCVEAKKCEICNQSYGELDANNHTSLSGWIFDETSHWKTCSACSTDIEKTAHSGGTATCTDAKKCEVCGQSYGEPSPSNHTHLSGWKFDETGHWKTCNDCNTDIEKTSHTGGAATCTEAKRCEICNQSYGELNPSNHADLSDWKFDETGHWKTCSACNTDIEKATHSGGTATCTAKKVCTICGEPYGGFDTSNHTALSDWKFDETGHWKTCSACNTAIEKSAHTGGAATCSAKKKCTICGEPYGELDPNNHTRLSDWKFDETGHWKTCSACNTDIEKATHSGGAATCTEAKKCEVCGESYGELDAGHHTALSDWKSDETGHWKTCEDCGAIIKKAAHSGGTATCTEAKKCEVCGESYGELDAGHHTALSDWKSDETGHWKTCEDCGAIIEKVAHSGGAATCNAKKKCEVCGEPYGELDTSNHTALSDWKFDETHHWKVCAGCNTTGIDNAAHTYGGWIIDKEATATETGSRHKVCTICNYETQTETIPATGPCTHERSTWEPANDGVHHVKKCTNCGAIIEKAAHSGGTATCTAKKKCEICGQSYGEPSPSNHTDLSDWKFDETDHWKTCNDCGAIIEEAAHSGGAATCTEAKKCEVCGQSYGEPSPSNHTYLSGWASDETHHWKDCADCNTTGIDKAIHAYSDWIIDKEATATETGSRHKVCTICNYETQTETIPATGPCTHERSTWEPANDGVHHVKKCTNCGAEPVIENHNFAYRDNSDNSHAMTCDVCKVSYTQEHDFSHKTVPAEDGKHRGQCICGAYGAAEDHTYQNGSCTACGVADPTPAKPTPGGSGIIITPEAADPVFLSGANQTVALGSAAAFRIDYNYAAFRSVAVDGVILDPANYTTWDGSTWVKLTAAYTKSLTPGTHTLSVYFDGATAATTFTVGGQPNPATGARDAVGIAAAAAVIALLGSAAILGKK